jgi:hypothetical protein
VISRALTLDGRCDLAPWCPKGVRRVAIRSPEASGPRGNTMGNQMESQARRLITLIAMTLTVAACSDKTTSIADYISSICAAPFRSAAAEEAPFLRDNVSAMTRMMIDMGIRPSGDVDVDFVAMMAPHHQGAIDMATAELRYGRNERLRRVAQEIIVTQQQEIAAMRLAVGEPLPASVSSPTQVSAQTLSETRQPMTR